jgi:hypothetical protein
MFEHEGRQTPKSVTKAAELARKGCPYDKRGGKIGGEKTGKKSGKKRGQYIRAACAPSFE